MKYTVRVTMTETSRYHIEADNEWEAKAKATSGDYAPYECVDASFDDVVVENELVEEVL